MILLERFQEHFAFTKSHIAVMDFMPYHFCLRIGPVINSSNMILWDAISPIIDHFHEQRLSENIDFKLIYSSGITLILVRNEREAMLLRLKFS